MIANVFDYRSCRQYLLAVLGDKTQRKGLKSDAAKFVGCHTTVISQILHGNVRLNLEQAERLNRFLNHNDDESHYFLLLAQYERAGTRTLQSYFQRQIDLILESRLVIKKRLGSADSVPKEDEQKYYESWIPSAVHVALSIPTLRTAEVLSRAFQIPLGQANDVLEFLVRAGFAKKEKGQYVIGPKHVHLGAASPHIANHHRNWRIKAIQSLDSRRTSDVHYSAAVTVSRDDAFIIKERMIEHLKHLNQVIGASPEEEVYGMNLDFFVLA